MYRVSQKQFLREIKRRNTQLEQVGNGLHCGAKILPHLLLAAATTHSDVKLSKRGHAAHFDFYLGHPVVEQTLMQTNCVLEPSAFSIFNDISHLAALLHEEFSVFLLVITCPDQSWIGHQFCTAAFCTILHI